MHKPYGTTHHLTTATGSRVTIHNEHDEYGCGSTHIVTGINTRGRSDYWMRNVSASQVGKAVRLAEAAGWTGITASIEAF